VNFISDGYVLPKYEKSGVRCFLYMDEIWVGKHGRFFLSHPFAKGGRKDGAPGTRH